MSLIIITAAFYLCIFDSLTTWSPSSSRVILLFCSVEKWVMDVGQVGRRKGNCRPCRYDRCTIQAYTLPYCTCRYLDFNVVPAVLYIFFISPPPLTHAQCSCVDPDSSTAQENLRDSLYPAWNLSTSTLSPYRVCWCVWCGVWRASP